VPEEEFLVELRREGSEPVTYVYKRDHPLPVTKGEVLEDLGGIVVDEVARVPTATQPGLLIAHPPKRRHAPWRRELWSRGYGLRPKQLLDPLPGDIESLGDSGDRHP
jgi:hypothetical protein